jgi:hypothetical protein
MKCIFALNQWSLEGARRWHEHLAVAINSLLANTRLQPVLLWTGDMRHPAIAALERWMDIIHATQMFEPIIAPIVEPDPPSTWRKEVCRVVMSKCELPFLIEDDIYIASDVDTMWLSDPHIPQFTSTLLAVPNAHMLYGGMLLVNRRKWLTRQNVLVAAAKDLLPTCNRCYEEPILARAFRDEWDPLPAWWQKFTYDALDRAACVVHFHGPKIPQIRTFSAAVPEKNSAIVGMFLKHKERYQHWARMASTYFNEPNPVYDVLEAILVGRNGNRSGDKCVCRRA